MATQRIEAGNRVFEIITPDSPDRRDRRIQVRVVSGPGLTEEGANEVVAVVRRECARLGASVSSVRMETAADKGDHP